MPDDPLKWMPDMTLPDVEVNAQAPLTLPQLLALLSRRVPPPMRLEQPMDSLDDLKRALAEFGFRASGVGEPGGPTAEHLLDDSVTDAEGGGPAADQVVGGPQHKLKADPSIDPGIRRQLPYDPTAKPDPQVQPYPPGQPFLRKAAFQVPAPLRAVPPLDVYGSIPGTEDENLLQPGEAGAVVGSRPVPGTADQMPTVTGGTEPGDPGVRQAGGLHEIRPEIPPLPTLFPRAWTSPLPYDLTYPGMDPKFRQPPAVQPKPANEAALQGSPLLQQAAFQVPGLQTPQASASPLLQYIGKLLGFGQDQTGEELIPGVGGALTRTFHENSLSPYGQYWYSPNRKVLRVPPAALEGKPVNEED